MAKDKEKQVNPAAAHRKAEKQRALKKSRQQLQTQRNEKLARRNPERIQRQIDELKQLEASGDIKQREKDILADLERDLRAVKKAKEALGQRIPDLSSGAARGDTRHGDGRGSRILGKRQHNGDRKQYSRHDNSGSDTDDSVRRIPMPEDTPPPMPREHRRYFNQKPEDVDPAATIPAPVQTTYSAAPQIRDLKQEAIKKFVPNVVRRKQEVVSGKGGLLVEPEQLDRLEAEGYYKSASRNGQKEEETGDNEETRRLAEEEARFEREMAMADTVGDEDDHDDDGGTAEVERRTRRVEIEEVEDEDG